MSDKKNYFDLVGYVKEHKINLFFALLMAIWVQFVLFGAEGAEIEKNNVLACWLTTIERVFVLFLAGLWFTHSKLLKYTAVILGAFLAVLTPLRLMLKQHLITTQNIDTMLNTDFNESISFLTTLPASSFLLMAVLFAVTVFLIGRCKTFESAVAQKTHRKLSVLAVAMVPLAFVGTSVSYLGYGLSEMGKPSTWKAIGEIEGHQKVKNYVIVVGEALRRDALHLFGNDYPTTPFIDSIPSKSIRLISPSFATMASVPRMLSITDIDAENKTATPHPENNIVALAKDAGFKTFWISSQMQTRVINLPISYMAKDADETHYVDRHNDFAILKQMKSILAQSSEATRLFVLHTYGSHENVCDRVEENEKVFSTSDKLLDCYLASALKTDRFLKEIHDLFVSKGESYSLLFFSDHGVDLEIERGSVSSERNPDIKPQFDAPFIEFGSNVQVTQQYLHLASAMEIAKYLPTWMGLKTNSTPENWNIFETHKDSVMYVLDPDKVLRRYDDLQEGPSINDLLKVVNRKD